MAKMDEYPQKMKLILEKVDENDSTKHQIQQLDDINELIENLSTNSKDADHFNITADGRYADCLCEKDIHDLAQVKSITLCYHSNKDLVQAEQQYGKNNNKLKFCLDSDVQLRLDNCRMTNNLHSPVPLNSTLHSDLSKQSGRLKNKMEELATGLSLTPPISLDFNVQRSVGLDKKYYCSSCSFILQEAVQAHCCGIRLCQSCLENCEGSTMKCPQCREEISKNTVFRDRAFIREMEILKVECSVCSQHSLLKDYQDHLDQCHKKPICDYCDEHFKSANELKMHKLNDCLMTPRSCPLKNFGCSHSVICAEMENHCLTEEHQKAAAAATYRDLSESTNPDQPDANTSSSGDINAELQLHKTSDVLSGETEALNHDVQRLSNQVIDAQNRYDLLKQQFLSLKSSIQEHQASSDEIQTNQTIFQQAITSMEQLLGDNQSVSRDGTLTWKITNVQEKMVDAQSERQTSIYSPPFYSSPTGYKMRVRLYLHGDGNARGTHMSLFFVLMRGPNDAILKFPFNYKITFCLFDQPPAQRHIIDSFRPDIKSISFQRPRSEMNIAIGIPKFIPLPLLQQENNPYIRDDTMFIKIIVDFGSIPHVLLPDVLSVNPGLPENVQHKIVRKMTARHHRRRLRRTRASMREKRRIAQSIRCPSPSSAIQQAIITELPRTIQ